MLIDWGKVGLFNDFILFLFLGGRRFLKRILRRGNWKLGWARR